MMYYEISDASENDEVDEYTRKRLKVGNTKIWYQKEFNMRHKDLYNKENIKKSHVCMGSIECKILEDLFECLQAEMWSPNGEARQLVKSRGTDHTSLSVGDIVEIGNKFYVCEPIGWREL